MGLDMKESFIAGAFVLTSRFLCYEDSLAWHSSKFPGSTKYDGIIKFIYKKDVRHFRYSKLAGGFKKIAFTWKEGRGNA
jgi:hypothetical protein